MPELSESVIEILREDLGVSDKTALDRYDPVAAASKMGRHWLYRLVSGEDGPACYSTKREAIEAAKQHIVMKRDQYERPESYRDIVSVLARRQLARAKKYQDDGLSEIEAWARIRMDE